MIRFELAGSAYNKASPIVLYKWDRLHKFQLGAPYKIVKHSQHLSKGNPCKWAIYATRLGVSASVIEIACSHTFKTKREAKEVLDTFLHNS